MSKPFHLTFKKNEEQMYEFLRSKVSVTAYIKELIKEDMERRGIIASSFVQTKVIEEIEEVNNMDFDFGDLLK